MLLLSMEKTCYLHDYARYIFALVFTLHTQGLRKLFSRGVYTLIKDKEQHK